jgi:hypothetical protein
MPTVADVLKRIERIKKDLEYVRTFQDKWRDQRDRFPKIYEGILEQEKAFLRKIEELRGLKVEGDLIGAEEPAPLGAPADEDPAGAKPRISPAPTPDGHIMVSPDPTPRPDSSDEKRAAAAEIGEKLRKRSGAAAPDAAAEALLVK